MNLPQLALIVAAAVLSGLAAGHLAYRFPGAGAIVSDGGVGSDVSSGLAREHTIGALLGGAFVTAAFALHSAYAAVAISVMLLELVIMFAIDLRHRLVYPLLVLVGAATGLVLNPVVGTERLTSCLAAGALALLVFGMLYLLGRVLLRVEAMGSGDVLLAGMIGCMTGLHLVMPALLLGMIIGGVWAAALLILRRSQRADYLPYGPSLCLGAMLMLLISTSPIP